MQDPHRFQGLPEYAFPRLRRLLDAHAPGGTPINMTIGEPRHPMPAFVGPILADNLSGFGVYPVNEGYPDLLAAIAAWIGRRYGVALGPDRLMVLNGTREGLFNAALALVPEQKNGARPIVLMPNPFYQVYALAALAVGAEPVYVPATAATGFLPDYAGLPANILNRTAAVYICSPANPQGTVASAAWWADLLALSERHDFRIFADECYSEIWRSTPPPGILTAAALAGTDPERVVAFNSLSKRSNLPGLRSGFVAGGPRAIAAIRQLRAYTGAPVPMPLQRISQAAWSDEGHVADSLALYHQKFADADAVFAGLQSYRAPEGGFFLWLPIPEGWDCGEQAALAIWQRSGVRVLPGAYFGRDAAGGTGGAGNPGEGYLRVALVASRSDTQDGLTRLRDVLYR